MPATSRLLLFTVTHLKRANAPFTTRALRKVRLFTVTPSSVVGEFVEDSQTTKGRLFSRVSSRDAIREGRRIMGDNVTETVARHDGHSEESPFPLTEVDKWILSQRDEEFKKHDWTELTEIIETNNLSVLKRTPSDLRRYMEWTAATKAQYGSMTQYLLDNRLPKSWGRPPFTADSQTPFASAADYKVLLNDWPYGLDPEITHIVVWSRTLIPTDPESGDMTPQSRALAQDFVNKYFVESLGPGGETRVLWFKNWVALQSVRSLEHIHVLVRNVDDDTLERWTGERPKRSAE